MALSDRKHEIEKALNTTCKNARILIVEDDPNYRFFLKSTLSKDGYINIEQAANGNEGYHKTLDYLPDIVILDLMMPICDGIEYCQRIRAHAEFSAMPILVQTGMGDIATHQRSFSAGATDLLTKPVNAEEFLARTRAHLERGQLERNVQKYRDVLQAEMRSADALQQVAMPTKAHLRAMEESYGLTISSHYQSSGVIGGDMWNVIPLSEKEVLIYCSDFTEQGMGSAMHAMRFQSMIRRIAEETPAPERILTKANLRLYDRLEVQQSAMLFVGIINSEKQTLTFAGAGVPRPMLLNPEQGRMEFLPIEQTTLGNVPEFSCLSHSVPFLAGDSLLLYSDALFSTCRIDGTCMDEAQVGEMARACLMQVADIPAKHKAFHACMCHNITASNAMLADDVLMVLLSKNTI